MHHPKGYFDMSGKKMVIYQLFPRLFGNKSKQLKLDGKREENGCGKFRDINVKALAELKHMGITHIWYTGIIEHAIVEGYPDHNIANGNPLVIKGRAGSPYAIKDYYDVNPDLAVDVSQRMDEFEALIERTHKSGMKAIIDFVPNHVAREYYSDAKPDEVNDFGADDEVNKAFDIYNNYYYLPHESFYLSPEIRKRFPEEDYSEEVARVTGNDCFSFMPSINDWYETVKLNYGIDYQSGGKKCFTPMPDTWKKMKHILHYWAAKGVDGFRCDMAEMVPVEFWNWVIPQLKQTFPWLVFIAEVYNPALYNSYIQHGHFDYLYDKVDLYDTLVTVIKNQAPASSITDCWQGIKGLDKYMLRFMENHDEQRLASRFIVGNPEKGIPAVAVSAFMHQGPLMIYNGQELGEKGEGESGYSGDDGRTTIFDYWYMPEHQKWMNEGCFDELRLSNDQKQLRQSYMNICRLCQHPAITEGLFYDLMWQNNANNAFHSDKLYAFVRYTQDHRLLIVSNFDEQKQQFKVQLPAHAFETMGIPRPVKIKFKAIGHDYGTNIGSEELISRGITLELDALNYLVLEFEW
jgi:glycosidase